MLTEFKNQTTSKACPGTPLLLAGVSNLRKYLDPCFEPLGFTRDAESFANAAYKSSLNGRTIQVGCAVRSRHQFVGIDNIRFRRYAGLTLEIRIETPLTTRLTLTPPGSKLNQILAPIMYRRLGLRRINSPNAAYSGFDVWAADPDWAGDFLSDPGVLKIVRDLFPASDSPPTSGLVFIPETMVLTQRPALEEITPEMAKNWLDSALALVALAEQKPANVLVEMTRFEKNYKGNPGLAIFKFVVMLFGVPVLAVFLLGLLLFLVGPWGRIVFLLFFMPVAFFLVAKKFIAAFRQKVKAASRVDE